MDMTPNTETPAVHQPGITAPLLHGSKRLFDRSEAAGIPASPLLGRLPLRRVIPMDVHSLLDYQGSLTLLGAGLVSDSPAACTTGIVLGCVGTGVSLLTDYRLSLVKVIPIKVHEALDYVLGIGAITAPFLFGYARRSPMVALTHVLVGISVVVGSLFTDYRAQRGIQWGRAASRTDVGSMGGEAVSSL